MKDISNANPAICHSHIGAFKSQAGSWQICPHFEQSVNAAEVLVNCNISPICFGFKTAFMDAVKSGMLLHWRLYAFCL